MTRTVTLKILLVAHDHDLSYDPAKEARRYRRGDIADVLLTPLHATRTGNDWHWNEPISSPRLGFVHMRGVPDDRWHNMRNRLSEDLVSHPDTPDTEETYRDRAGLMTVRRRKWRFQIPLMAETKRDELLANKEVTLAWTAARQLIRRKAMTNHLDQSTDDESNAVQDSDLPGPT